MDSRRPLLIPNEGDEPPEPPLAGVSDFRGRPVYRATSGGWRSALFVAGECVLCILMFVCSVWLILFLNLRSFDWISINYFLRYMSRFINIDINVKNAKIIYILKRRE